MSAEIGGVGFSVSGIERYIGVAISPRSAADTFWKIRCPCGVEVSYPINGLPLIDTRHPCGNENHWSVRIYESEGE